MSVQGQKNFGCHDKKVLLIVDSRSALCMGSMLTGTPLTVQAYCACK